MLNKMTWRGFHLLNKGYTHKISKFLDIVMLEFVKDLMKNLLEFLLLFVLIPSPMEGVTKSLCFTTLGRGGSSVLDIKFRSFLRKFND